MDSVSDKLFSETAQGKGLGSIRRVQPAFILEEFLHGVKEDLVPSLMQRLMDGDQPALEDMFTEDGFEPMRALLNARRQAGVADKSRVLDIREFNFVNATEVDGYPAVVVSFMVQQVYYLMRVKTGDAEEGSIDNIVNNTYVLTMQLRGGAQEEEEEDAAEPTWKIREFGLQASLPAI